VLGAFKATPIRQLETKVYVPPLDLWLNSKIARFQAQLERTGLARQIRNASTAIRTLTVRHMYAATTALAPDYGGSASPISKVTLGESRQCVYCGGIEWMCRRSARSSGQVGRDSV
jgi:hypothetical protein